MTPEERYRIAKRAFGNALAHDRDGVIDDLARLNGDERRQLRELTVDYFIGVLDDMEGAE